MTLDADISPIDTLNRLIDGGLEQSDILAAFRERRTKFGQDLVDAAMKDRRLDDELNVDDDALLSVGDDDETGGWVSAWIWVDLGDDYEREHEEEE